MSQLHLDQAQIDRARDSARRIARQVFDEMAQFTTTTVERATLRLLGVDSVDEHQVPLPNRLVDHLQEQGLLDLGAAPVLADAMQAHDWSAQQVAQAVASGTLTLSRPKNEQAARLAADS